MKYIEMTTKKIFINSEAKKRKDDLIEFITMNWSVFGVEIDKKGTKIEKYK